MRVSRFTFSWLRKQVLLDVDHFRLEKKFGYDPEKSVAENKTTLEKMEAWIKQNTKEKGSSSAAAG